MFAHRAYNLTRKPTLTFILQSESNIMQYIIDAQGPDGNHGKRKYNKSQKIQGNASKKADCVLIRTFKEKILARYLTISYIYLCSCLKSQLLTGNQNRNWFGNTNSCHSVNRSSQGSSAYSRH